MVRAKQQPAEARTGQLLLLESQHEQTVAGHGGGELLRQFLRRLAARRKEQQVKWLWTMLDERLIARLKSDPALKSRLPALETAVAEGRLSAALAVEEIADAMGL